MEKILTDKEELSEMINQAVQKQFQIFQNQEKKDEKQPIYFGVNEAEKYISSLGLKVPKSTLYKLTSEKKIDFLYLGSKVVFTKENLDNYIKKSLKSNDGKDIARAVADNIK